MAFKTILKKPANVCGRCGHVWLPRTRPLGTAQVCPKCKTRYWNRPRIRKKVIEKAGKEG